MSHEQSETVQDEAGKWANVYGRATARAGQRLPGTPQYDTLDAAETAARERSRAYQPSPSIADRLGQVFQLWQENVRSPGERYDPRSYMPPRGR